MTASLETILLGFSILLLLSILASKASSRLGVPALLLFLVIGMLAGSEGPGGIYFDDPSLAQSIGVVSLALILFAGGLDTNWQSVRPVLWHGFALSTVGVLITTFLVGLFAARILSLSLLEGLLLGAIVSSTDAAAVFGILRARGVGLKGYLTPLIELESGTNDPIAVFLTVSLISLLVNPNVSVFDLVPAFVLQMVLGAVLGTIMGRGMVIVMNRLRLEYEGLYPVLSLSLVLLTYSATTAVGGNGFLAVYLAGLVMGNNDFIHKSSLRRFHDGLAWLMQITMFLTLGLLVFPSRLLSVIDAGLLIAAFLILVARPASVFTTLLFSRLDAREKALVSWVGLRGAVPIILATFPLLAGLPIADLFFNLVFFVVLTSVILQGPTIPLIARWLGVDAPATARSKPPLELVPVSDSMNSELVELEIAPDSTVAGKQIVDLHLPPDALILLINRNNEFIVPRGGTILQAGDRLLVLADKEALARIQAIVGARGPKT
jgi:cell volume regulation protein A